MDSRVTPIFIIRQCRLCPFLEKLPRAGKLWNGYRVEAEVKRDFERRKYAKEILQPKDKKGNTSELYQDAWGDPYKKSGIGSQVDEARIDE